MQYKIIIQLLENITNYKLLNEKFGSLTDQQQNYFKEIINNIKYRKLYKSAIHGICHSEKVCLFAYLLGIKLGLSEGDIKIITDAAVYHDFKRQGDSEDTLHGLAAANNISEITKNDIFYENETNLKILKAIVEVHSVSDNYLDIIFNNYEIPESEKERYYKLAKILKDADALDRKRFCDKSIAKLKPEFLRFNESLELIELSESINEEYREILRKDNFKKGMKELLREEGECLHSIGFDFFRIKSVLENGILSYNEMQKKGLTFPKNFDGGNQEAWISVVPTSLLCLNANATQNFIQNGIVFVCNKQILYCPMAYDQRSKAMTDGMPYDKGGYKDERYVYLKITPNQIYSFFVPNKYINADVNTLNYLYNTLYFPRLEEKINYVLKNIGFDNYKNISELIPLMSKYEEVLNEWEKLDLSNYQEHTIEVNDKLTPILNEINKLVQNLIHAYYAMVLNKNINDKITVKEVVDYELSQLTQNFDCIKGDEELIYVQNGYKLCKKNN